jgi:hypothetical protein
MPIISLYRLPDGPCRLQQKPKKQPGVNGSSRRRYRRTGPFGQRCGDGCQQRRGRRRYRRRDRQHEYQQSDRGRCGTIIGSGGTGVSGDTIPAGTGNRLIDGNKGNLSIIGDGPPTRRPGAGAATRSAAAPAMSRSPASPATR